MRTSLAPVMVFAVRLLMGAACLACCLVAVDARAQVDAEPSPAREYPRPFEAPAQYQVLRDQALEDQATIESLAAVDALQAELNDERRATERIRGLVVTATDAEYMRPERIARMRDQALLLEQRLEAIRSQAATNLDQLQVLSQRWLERQDYWLSWREALRGDERFPAVADDFAGALELIEQVLREADPATDQVLDVQQQAVRMQAEARRLADQVAAIRAGRREALLQRAQPILFSATYFAQLEPELMAAWQPEAVLRAGGYGAFLADNLGILLLHLLLIAGFGVLARRIGRRAVREGAWYGLLHSPWTLAVFAATALVSPLYRFSPPGWDVIMWTLLAGGGVLLATRVIRHPRVRLLLYFFAGFYPLLLLVEAVQLPIPIVRPILTAIAAVAFVLFGLLMMREVASSAGAVWARWTLGVGALMWFVVLVAEVLGFYLLVRWILHATVTSAYVAFVVILLLMLARGASGTVVRLNRQGRRTFFGRVGYPLAERLLRLFQIVLVVAAALNVLDIWELTPSPAETWAIITGWGFTVAGVQITIGRILAAALLVYIAILASWLVRTFTRAEVYPRWELERGVGDSINTLVHYGLITLGFLIALGALGVELRNFAIVAGALGVGIGFGLQNIVNNFVSGLVLLFERPVRVGDTVVIDGELGSIHKIGLRSTTVLNFDKAEIIVPNADLVSEKVTNWTLTDPVARLILPVGVAYGSDVQRVLTILREVAAEHPQVLDFPEPQPLFKEFGDSALEFELRVWVDEIRFRMAVRSDLLVAVDQRFREAGIEIPFPQRDLHLRSVDSRIVDAVRKASTDVSDGTPGERG